MTLEKEELVPTLVYRSQGFSKDHGKEMVTLDFEYADDFHVSLTPEDWQRFVASLPDQDVKAFFLSNYKAHGNSLAFEDALDELSIQYDTIAFFDE
ncbi:hypothetical protein [Lacticaseibacillus mingshuiensis]|uniref:Uncharacterized protein n=1 Tax=Lacticaseibacillus mingshuiensis TaxID=2799574 RepID=A0ABW4CGZ4_9LACO|nr:hypothetical protein [Lacticaseibacillus mingshuiensis]